MLAEVTEAGWQLREAALDVPHQVAGCVQLETEEATQLYQLLYRLLGNINE